MHPLLLLCRSREQSVFVSSEERKDDRVAVHPKLTDLVENLEFGVPNHGFISLFRLNSFA